MLVPEAATALEQVGTALSFTDQGNNLAGVFFQASLPSYLGFLYFLSYDKNRTPPLGQFGFQFLLLFVLATIPTGIISKVAYGTTLANVDWLHGSAELLLTVTNVLIVLGFRAASTGDEVGAQGELPRKVALGIAAVVALVCATGSSLGLEAHSPFLFGLGDLGPETVGSIPFISHAEPENALSLPTWAIHFSSVFEWLFAMQVVWRYAAVTGNERWKGLTYGMLPLHASGLAACTYHIFFNDGSLQFLVELQAFLTLLGNTTLAIAAFRIATSNGWAFADLNPLPAIQRAIGKEEADEGVAAEAAASELAELPALRTYEGESGLLLSVKLVALTTISAYLVKYGELAIDAPFSPNAILAALLVLAPPAYVAYSYQQPDNA